MLLKEDQKAPDFALKDKEGNIIRLSRINSRFTIVYFYPKDSTPGCTIEANEFTKHLDDFEKLDVRIIGISGGDENSKKKFCEKNNIKTILLSDTDFKISKKYMVYGEKSFMGRKFMGIKRMTFILDKDRKIIKVYSNVKAEGHAEEILKFMRDLNGN